MSLVTAITITPPGVSATVQLEKQIPNVITGTDEGSEYHELNGSNTQISVEDSELLEDHPAYTTDSEVLKHVFRAQPTCYTFRVR